MSRSRLPLGPPIILDMSSNVANAVKHKCIPRRCGGCGGSRDIKNTVQIAHRETDPTLWVRFRSPALRPSLQLAFSGDVGEFAGSLSFGMTGLSRSRIPKNIQSSTYLKLGRLANLMGDDLKVPPTELV